MVFKSVKGMFQLKQNYRDAFQLEAFNEKYIEECMDRYLFIVGDISSGILRLKGFDNDPKSPNYQGNIPNYLEVSCAFGCPFYVLKHIRSEEEYSKLEKDTTPVDETGGMEIIAIKKENFDKDSLVLKSTPKTTPNIVIDPAKINAIPVGTLAPDLVEFVQQDKNASTPSNNRQTVTTPKEEVQTTSYVSSSPDFDPSKSNSSRFNRNNQNRNRNKNKNQSEESNNNASASSQNKPVNNNNRGNNQNRNKENRNNNQNNGQTNNQSNNQNNGQNNQNRNRRPNKKANKQE